jgi:hypothetical protein
MNRVCTRVSFCKALSNHNCSKGVATAIFYQYEFLNPRNLVIVILLSILMLKPLQVAVEAIAQRLTNQVSPNLRSDSACRVF